MKKILFITLTFFLVSCGSTSPISDANVKSFSWSWFSVNIPSSWSIVNKSQIPSVKSWKIELAVSSSDISSWFANNLIIVSEKLNEKITSLKYWIINYALTTWNYLQFTKLDEKTISFSDSDTSNLYIFEAKYNTTTPLRKFLQTSKVCGNQVYLITIWLSIDITDTTKYEDLTKSFNCKTI